MSESTPINPLLDKDFREKIKASVQGILDTSFVSGPKTTIRDMHGRLTFACPYCGDSEKDVKKKRGNLFWNTLQYHCYNYGCNIHKPLHTLLKDFDVVNINTDERLAIMDYIKHNQVASSKSSSIEFELFNKLKELSIPLDVFYKITGTRPITKESQGYQVLKDRLLVHKADEFSWRFGRLFVLNLTPDKKGVIGYQVRRITKDTGNKYFTFHIEKLREQAGISTLDKCENAIELDKLNKLSTIFGIMTVDFTRTVTSFEGPIDSKFMINSIGQATVGRDMGMFDDIPDVRYFYDNDKSGKEAATEQMKKGHEVFLWRKFIADNGLSKYITKDEPLKDLNDIIKTCYKYKLDAYKQINNYFSNKVIDLYYI
jgi:hypothetical protein